MQGYFIAVGLEALGASNGLQAVIEADTAGAAQITSIPTIMAFREGILVFRQSGALPPTALEQVIDGIKALDMAEVRASVAVQQGAASQA